MSNARDIIIRPIITEKTMKLMDTDNKITFAVAKGANKTQVRLAVEEIFGVKVEQVNILQAEDEENGQIRRQDERCPQSSCQAAGRTGYQLILGIS